ncbi:MAG TPA: peptidylprolyl isomerase [Methylophilaceae bacterium]|nr:peptidylprolyl isomerase [Methylophilaceae bacterium]
MKISLNKSLAAALLMGTISFQAMAADNVATVNGKPIKQSLYDYIVKEANARGQNIDENTRKVIVDKLIASELVFQEAQRQGIDKHPDYLAKQELTNRELLVNTYLQDYLKKNPVSEADIRAAYDKYKTEVGNKEYSARHILVATEAEAKDIITQLGKGADFAKLAKEKSLDPGSKEKGGDLGWFSLGSMVKQFSEAVTKLPKGSYTQTPIQTQFGWHVIKLENSRDLQPPAYEKVKEGLQKQLQQRQLEKLLSDLRSKAKIVDGSAPK